MAEQDRCDTVRRFRKIQTKRTLVFAGGERSCINPSSLENVDSVICADSGLEYCLENGLIPNYVVGDMDSVNEDMFLNFKREHPRTLLKIYPRDKDRTDLHLAMTFLFTDVAVAEFYGCLGGRLDQTLSNIDLVCSYANSRRTLTNVTLFGAREDIHILVGHMRKLKLKGKPGDVVSLMSWRAQVSKVCISDVEFPLEDKDLKKGESLGISNKMLDNFCDISIESGTLIVIHSKTSK